MNIWECIRKVYVQQLKIDRTVKVCELLASITQFQHSQQCKYAK